jgi:RNA 3'-terminal phosphate cyclase (ATP)
MSEWIEIDGSMGEGGGQVLRTSLSLSLITGKPLHLSAIRSRRPKPGLQPQHLTAVQAAAAVGRAEVTGGELGSQELTFRPASIRPGAYRFDIGTAGATSLVFQTIFFPLSLAAKAATLTLTGGTHVPWSPSFHYLDLHWSRYLMEMGFKLKLFSEKAGFYPQGGGSIQAVLRPSQALQPLQLAERGNLLRINGISAAANLDEEIAQRQKHQALRRLEPLCRDTKIKTLNLPAQGKGTFILLIAEFEQGRACYTALGEKGKPAEKVADEACDPLQRLLNLHAGMDEYLADQLLLPLALAQGPSRFVTPHITGHLLTNAQVIRKFLPVDIIIQGNLDEEGWISIHPGPFQTER